MAVRTPPRHPDRHGDHAPPAARQPGSQVEPKTSDPAPDEIDDVSRSLLDQLIAATRLYNSSKAVDELMQFIVRMRRFAPFNAMLLHIQKPGLTHVASAQDWWDRFGRVPKEGARPLLILRTKGPVDFVFDILDTEGRDVPVDAFAFPTFGNLTDNRFTEFMQAVEKERIDIVALSGWLGRKVRYSPLRVLSGW